MSMYKFDDNFKNPYADCGLQAEVNKLAGGLYAEKCKMTERFLKRLAESCYPRDMYLLHDPHAAGEPTYICCRDDTRLAKVWTETKLGESIQVKGEILPDGLKVLRARL